MHVVMRWSLLRQRRIVRSRSQNGWRRRRSAHVVGIRMRCSHLEKDRGQATKFGQGREGAEIEGAWRFKESSYWSDDWSAESVSGIEQQQHADEKAMTVNERRSTRLRGPASRCSAVMERCM